MTESSGTYYSTLPDGRVLLACTLPDGAKIGSPGVWAQIGWKSWMNGRQS